MSFADRDDAKEFLISRIAAEAHRQGSLLADLEKKMLLWTESYPIRGIRPEELGKLHEDFSKQFNDAEFESRIAGLAKSAFESQESSVGRESFQSAFQYLEKEDHYINIMLQSALGPKLRKKLFGIF